MSEHVDALEEARKDLSDAIVNDAALDKVVPEYNAIGDTLMDAAKVVADTLLAVPLTTKASQEPLSLALAALIDSLHQAMDSNKAVDKEREDFDLKQACLDDLYMVTIVFFGDRQPKQPMNSTIHAI